MNRLALAASLLALSVAGVAHAQATLTPKYEPGSYKVTSIETVSQGLNIVGMEISTKITATTTESVTVGAREADGKLKLTRKTDSIASKFELPGGMDVEFDSEKNIARSSTPELQGLVDAWKALVGKSITVVMDKDNKITSVEGADKLFPPTLTGEFADAIKASYTPERLQKTAAQAIGALPDKPVVKGDKWKRTEHKQLGGGQYLEYQTNYEYQGTVEKEGKQVDRITIFIDSVKYGVEEGGQLPATVKSSDLQIGSSMGFLLFDREKGQVIERSVSTKVTGNITLEVMGMELPAKLDLTLDDYTISKR